MKASHFDIKPTAVLLGPLSTLSNFLFTPSLDAFTSLMLPLAVIEHASADRRGSLSHSDPRTWDSRENWSSVTRSRPQKLANGQKLQVAAGRPQESHRLGQRLLEWRGHVARA